MIDNKKVAGGLFTILAILISWFINRSIGWAIVHGIFGLFYILYAIITGDLSNGEGQKMLDYYFN